MSSANEVKREFEGKLSEATANEKFLYNRVMELEKRNQKLEKRVKKLKKRKKELKEEVAKLRYYLRHTGHCPGAMGVSVATGTRLAGGVAWRRHIENIDFLPCLIICNNSPVREERSLGAKRHSLFFPFLK